MVFDYFIKEALNMIEPARKLAKKIPDANSSYWTAKLLKSVKAHEHEVSSSLIKVLIITRYSGP